MLILLRNEPELLTRGSLIVPKILDIDLAKNSAILLGEWLVVNELSFGVLGRP